MLDTLFDKGTVAFSGIYIYIIVVSYLLYGFVFLGIISVNYTYLRYFSSFVQLCIALFLMYRFNPFRTQIALQKGDSMIIYSSGFFLLLNLGATEFVLQYYKKIKEITTIIK
jgi:hypothetical protein